MKFIPATVFCCCLLLLWVAGCKKPEDVGSEVLPSFDLLKTPTSDTATIQTITLREDSLRANGLSKILLGSYIDPDFGLSQASIYMQVLLGNTPSLGSGTLIADSLVLSLAYIGFYGDTSTQQTLHLTEITDSSMSADSVYYTNKTFNTGNNLVTPYPFTPHPNDSVLVGTTNQPAQLRVTLNSAMADTFLARLQQPLYKINLGWLSAFKGVYLSTDVAIGGAILYFDPASAYSKMTLYYHDSSASNSYDFALDGVRVNHEVHDYTSSPAITASLANPTFTNSDTENYLQSMAGLRVKVRFPYLKHFTDSGNVVINKAELVLTALPETSGKYPAPDNILLTAFDSTGVITFVPDYYESNFGGTYNSTNSTYTFSITRQIQQILDGKVADYDFSLNVLSAGIQANRVIIDSGKSAGSKMKLRLFYTRLPQSIKRQPANNLKPLPIKSGSNSKS